MNTGLRLISSTREKDKLELNEGESFVYDRESKNGILTFWRCYKRGKCKARLHLTKEALERLKNGQSVEPSSWKTLGRHIHDKKSRSDYFERPFNTAMPESTQNTTSDVSNAQPPLSSNRFAASFNVQHGVSSVSGQIANNDYMAINRPVLRQAKTSAGAETSHSSQPSGFVQEQQNLVNNLSESGPLNCAPSVQQNVPHASNISAVLTISNSTTRTVSTSLCHPFQAKRARYDDNTSSPNQGQVENRTGHDMPNTSLTFSQNPHRSNVQNVNRVPSALKNTLKVYGNSDLNRDFVKKLLQDVHFLNSKISGIAGKLTNSTCSNLHCEIICKTREDVVELFDTLKSHETKFNITVELCQKEEINVQLDSVPFTLEDGHILSYLQQNHGTVSASGVCRNQDEDGYFTETCTVVMKRRDLDRNPISDKIVIDKNTIYVSYEDQRLQHPPPTTSSAVLSESNDALSFLALLASVDDREINRTHQISEVQSSGSRIMSLSSSTTTTISTNPAPEHIEKVSTQNLAPPILPALPTQAALTTFLPVRCSIQSSISTQSTVCAAATNSSTYSVGNTQQSRPQQYPQQPSRFIPPLHNYRMNYNNNHGLRARHPLTNNAPSCFQQATGFAPPICNQVQPALPQQPHRNRGYDIMSNPPLAHPGGASQHSNPSQHSQIAVVPIQDMHAETSGTMVQVGDYIPTMSRKPDEAALQIPNQNSQLLSTSQTGGVGQPLTNQNNEFDSQQPTHEECRQNMMDTSFINSGNLGTIDSIGNNISSLNQNFHEVEQPASNQYTELQSTSKSQQQQQTDEENRVDVEETASIQRSDLSEVEDSESDKLSSDSSDGEADDDMSEDSLYGSVENSQHRKIICKLTKYEDECGSDDVYHLQRLYKRIHEINDEQLTSKALELFPQKLSFRYATFTELDSFLFVLTKVEKCIEMLDLSHRFSKPEDVGRIFSAIQQMPGKIRELRISGNIIPKIPSSSFFNKVSEELWMRRCFHDEGTRNGKRDANQSEKDKIQKNLDQLDNLELEVYVGVDEDGCLVSLSSQKQFAVTTTKNAERRKITHKIEKFQRGCNVYGGKEYEATELLRVYEQILQINDEQLTTYAAELFPEELSLYPIKLTESQIDSFLFILTKVEKRIEGLLLDECFSKPEDVGRLFEAIQAMPGKIGELDISGNIIPKIPSKSFFNKIEDELNMFNCFPVDDAINGQRNANQSEIAEIQRVLDQLDDSKLKVNLGLRDGEPVELRSRK
ncbi:uncharacterized protein LOC143471281 isoform X2 [Clavelina lepadiformis]|uniref:uncharacterized protein LOC143471281 isoform X2 n=1 Tax=Clavelina lepadiformis TaxID=159417 RepID=UPI004041F9BC